MTEQKKTKAPKNWLNIALCLFIVFSLSMAGYLGWKSYNLEQQNTQLLQAIDTHKIKPMASVPLLII